jgi:exodeoxyribonuclease VII small subunit
MAKKSKKNFENDLKRLEEISDLLESESIGLDESLKLYEEGIELSRNCITALKKAELKITELKKKLDDLPFEEEAEEED